MGTWYVVCHPNRVVLEIVSMTLDVPIVGTAFNLVVCDTFTSRDGIMKMARTCSVEWVQSCWFKAMVEREAAPGAVEVARKLVEAIRTWAGVTSPRATRSNGHPRQ